VRVSLAPLAVLAALAAAPARADVSDEPDAATPWLGISYDSNRPLPLVTEVHPGTAAASAGLQPGDEIQDFDDMPLSFGIELAPLVIGHRVGDRVPIRFTRGDRVYNRVARLTAKPPIEEIVYRRFIDRLVPPVTPYDRHGAAVPAAERIRRPQIWAVFSVRCDDCAAQAAALAARLAESGVHGRSPLPMRIVLIGYADEAAAYLDRVPVVGTVWRMDTDARDEWGAVGEPLGRRFLTALAGQEQVDGVILQLDENGVVRFATALSVGDQAHEGVCAAAARYARSWRR
jgi:hypothetical protein